MTTDKNPLDRLSRKFNDFIDDEEVDFEVVLRTNDDDEAIILARPSLALYHGDRELYDEHVSRFKQDSESETLELELFPRNENAFRNLR